MDWPVATLFLIICCRNIQLPSNRRIRVFGFHTAPVEHNELHQFREFIKTMPRFKPRHVVLADQVEKLGGRVAKAE